MGIQINGQSDIISATDGSFDLVGANINNVLTLGSGVYISSPQSNTLAFGTNSTEVGRFNGSGNLGIGTTNPSSKLDIYGTSKISKNFNGSFVTDTTPILSIVSTASQPVYNSIEDYSKRVGIKIDVGYASTNFDTKILIPDWRNSNLNLQKSDGNYQPGTIIRGRVPDNNFNSGIGTLYYNGYCDIFPSSTVPLGAQTSEIINQTSGYSPSNDYLKHGIINDRTIITSSEYFPYQTKEFGAGGTGRIGFCCLTYSGDMLVRLSQESGSYMISGVNVDGYADPGAPVQTIMSGPINSGSLVKYTPYDYSIGSAIDYRGETDKNADRNVLGKIVKIVGNIESTISVSGFFCLTENGYVWATTEHNTYGWLNQGNTTNVQEPVIVWDIFDYDHQDRYATVNIYGAYAVKKVANITSTHDFADDSDNTGGIIYLKVVQEIDRYHEMWTTGGYNGSSQLADGTVTARNFSKACLFNVTDDSGQLYTGTYLQSSDGINAGVAGTDVRITFTSDPNLYLGEFIRIDFTTGTSVDDSYEVTEKNGTGIYTVQRHTGKNARVTTSLNTSGTFSVLGRSQLLRKLNRTILGQWSGGGNAGFCFIQDSTYRIWVVGEAASGIHGDGTTVDKLYFKEISTATSLPLQEIYKMVIGGTDAAFCDAFILFKNWTLWHAGRNTSGYGYNNVTQKLTWTQIAGPGCSLTNPPTGNVYNFWTRPRSAAGVASADSLYVIDYTDANGWGLWCCGNNASYQLANGTVTASTIWTVPTKFPQNYGTAASPIRTKTGWIPEQMWSTTQAGSAGNGFIAMFRNLSTNEYRTYAWGYNGSGLLGDGTVTTPITPFRLVFDIPAYKIKDISVKARDTSYDGIGLMISYDGDLYGIGGARYAVGAPATYPEAAFWNPSNGTANCNKWSRNWMRVNPLGPY